MLLDPKWVTVTFWPSQKQDFPALCHEGIFFLGILKYTFQPEQIDCLWNGVGVKTNFLLVGGSAEHVWST